MPNPKWFRFSSVYLERMLYSFIPDMLEIESVFEKHKIDPDSLLSFFFIDCQLEYHLLKNFLDYTLSFTYFSNIYGLRDTPSLVLLGSHRDNFLVPNTKSLDITCKTFTATLCVISVLLFNVLNGIFIISFFNSIFIFCSLFFMIFYYDTMIFKDVHNRIVLIMQL